MTILKGLETEKTFLLEQITVLSSKTIDEREKCNDLHQQLGNLRTKYSKLSVKNRKETRKKPILNLNLKFFFLILRRRSRSKGSNKEKISKDRKN